MKTTTIRQTVHFKARPHDVYDALMDSKKHAQFTGAKARISKEIGGLFEAYDGWIKGRNVELIPDKKIVQAWWADDDKWPEGHESHVTFLFDAFSGGTKLTLIHTDVPDDWKEDLSQGWKEYYWEPMKEMLEDEE